MRNWRLISKNNVTARPMRMEPSTGHALCAINISIKNKTCSDILKVFMWKLRHTSALIVTLSSKPEELSKDTQFLFTKIKLKIN